MLLEGGVHMPTIEASLATAIGSAVTDVTGAFSTVTGWFPVTIAIGLFGAGLVVSLIASFFGKRKRRKR